MSTDYGALKTPARDRILQVMSDLHWHSWKELKEVGGVRYGARLLELRRMGYEMVSHESHDVPNDTGKVYRLISTERHEPQGKQVKVFLTERETVELLQTADALSTGAIKLNRALASYRANKDKL